MNPAKIRLSEEEAALIQNAQIILTKNLALQKMKGLLEGLVAGQEDLLRQYGHHLPADVRSVPPKVSRGEHYQGLPYLVLDHPRYFGKEQVFAIRTLFWWGHYFSVTLHLSGQFRERYLNAIAGSAAWLGANGFYFANGPDEWDHRIESPAYQPVAGEKEPGWANRAGDGHFLKLAKTIPLTHWDTVEPELLKAFWGLLNCLAEG